MSLERTLKAATVKTPASEQVNQVLRTLMPRYQPPSPGSWPRAARELRQRLLDEVYLWGYSRKQVQRQPRVVWGATLKPAGAPFVIRKLRYECHPGYWVPALLYEPRNVKGPLPAVLNPNGHHAGGKAATYKQIRCANLARRGMLALNFEFIGMSELEADVQHNRAAQLSLTGQAGVGLFYLAMRKALDVLLAHPQIDKRRVAMTGLSGGGWQTIILSALDERITASVPVAGYTALRTRVGCVSDIGDYEQVPPDLAAIADYDTMTAMLAPRPAMIVLNEFDDCCFATARTRPVVFDPIRPTYRALGAQDKFTFHSNQDPGTHNYGLDNRRALYRFLNQHFELDSPADDLHAPGDIFTERQLRVGLPEEQETIGSLARSRARELITRHKPVTSAIVRKQLRRRLEAVLRLPDYQPARLTRVVRTAGGWRGELRAGPWQVPMAGAWAGAKQPTTLALSDDGLAALHYLPTKRLNLLTMDVTGQGTQRIDHRQAMLLDSTGQRLLGVQVAQVIAAAQVLAQRAKVQRISAYTVGWTSSTIVLLAAALRPKLFDKLEGVTVLSSLSFLIEHNKPYEQYPSLYCPDLLATVDIDQLRDLLEDVRYVTSYRASPEERDGKAVLEPGAKV